MPQMMNPFSLADRVIMITGAGQGIGRALAEFAVASGARVALLDQSREGATALATSLGNDRARAYVGSVADEAFVNDTVGRIVADFGDLHGLVNGAGIVRAAMIQNLTLAQWQSVVDVNLTGAFLCLRAAATHMIRKAERGDARPGSIVNISSVAGRRGTIGQINYGASKSGLLGLTMSAARELGRYQITVNSVCYGTVETPMTETIVQEKFRDKYLKQIVLGRFSKPEDVAPGTCFLLTEAASYITGQHLSIDGGFHITA